MVRQKKQRLAAATSILGTDIGRARPITFGEYPPADLDAAVDAVDEVVRLARVTGTARRNRLRLEVAELVGWVRRHQDRRVIAEREERRERSGELYKRLALAHAALGKATADYQLAMVEYDNLDSIWPNSPDELLEIDDLLNNVQMWLERHPLGFERRRGRPSGNLYFIYFVCLLLSLVGKAGGKLKLDKNYPKKSSLPRALELLRPHMPQGFIRTNPSVRALIKARRFAANPLLTGLARGNLSHRGRVIGARPAATATAAGTTAPAAHGQP